MNDEPCIDPPTKAKKIHHGLTPSQSTITQSALSTLRLPATSECQGLPLYRAVFGVQSLHQDQLEGLPAGCLQYVILVESYIHGSPNFKSQQSLSHDALGFGNSI